MTGGVSYDMGVNRISDYGMIGDCYSMALVGRDGSIDWACFPRFDSPAVFCRILDDVRGGHFSATPLDIVTSYRRYMDDTNVLITTFECTEGILELTDCMPIGPVDSDGSTPVPHQAVLRRLVCKEGEVRVMVEVAPRFEYGSFTPRFRLSSPFRGEVVGGSDALWLNSTAPMSLAGNSIVADWNLTKGQEEWVEASWTPSFGSPHELETRETMRHLLDRTVQFWRSWISACWYDGEYQEALRRSALVLKALTYIPTGAVVAAGTTSLPEKIGGPRNWDYRYTWIRDATLTVTSLYILGFRSEADEFKAWLERTGAGRPEDLQIMYGIAGERMLPELELPHLAGHRGSRPVRIGNKASHQVQLDAYGQILQSTYLYGKAGGALTAENWRFAIGLADMVCKRWRDPDNGIWEIRDEPRHFVHSKLNCWVALDRAIRVAEAFGLPGDVDAWTLEREAIREWLMSLAEPLGWFPQAAGFEDADAATLLVPAFGFLPTTHPLVERTIEVVRRELERGGLVHRYRSPDGMAGGEGAFLLCSFWLVDCLVHSGRLEEAEELLNRLLALSNDLGLFSEEADPDTGDSLGNFPQAFTHMALVASCAYLSAALHGDVRYDAAQDYAETALGRLIAARGQIP